MSSSALARDFFTDFREWSRWKHQMLRGYVPKFGGILGQRYPKVYFVDGFAGAGAYDGPPLIQGSPLIAAQIADYFAHRGSGPIDLRCVNVEPDLGNFADLERRTAPFGNRVTNHFGTFRDNFDVILNQVGNSPALFFLDPFGYRGVEWDVMERLAQRACRNKTELIINFNVRRVDRDAGWVDSIDQPAAPSFINALTSLFGTNEWVPIIESDVPYSERCRLLWQLYMKRLANLFGGTVGSYPVRTVENALKYYLVYVTRSNRGMREMGDVIFRIEHAFEAGRTEHLESRGRQLSFDDMINPPPDESTREAQVIDRLAADILRVGGSRRLLTFGNLQDLLAVRWFGRVTEKHFRRACVRLIREGRIDRDRETGINDRTILKFK